MEQPEKVVKGLEIILKLFPDATGYIAIENNKPDAIEKVVKTVGNNPRIKVLALMTKYPQGSEKQLINAVTGREVPSGALPANAGCIVDNVDTVVAIETAVCEDRPLMRRIVTLTGKAANNPGNYEIRIGMNMNELIEMAGGLNEDLGKIIAGGPMMGPAMFSTDCPFIKTSSALLCLTKKDADFHLKATVFVVLSVSTPVQWVLCLLSLISSLLQRTTKVLLLTTVLIVLNVVLALMYVQLNVTLLRLSESVSVKQWLL